MFNRTTIKIFRNNNQWPTTKNSKLIFTCNNSSRLTLVWFHELLFSCLPTILSTSVLYIILYSLGNVVIKLDGIVDDFVTRCKSFNDILLKCSSTINPTDHVVDGLKSTYAIVLWHLTFVIFTPTSGVFKENQRFSLCNLTSSTNI